MQSTSSLFDERFESSQSVIPLFRDGVEILLRFGEWLRIESEAALAAAALMADDTDAFEDAEVLRYRLARQARALGELRD